MNNINCCAYNITRPSKKPRPWEFKGATAILDSNRKGIAKLRQRGFSWTQVHQALQRVGINVNYANLYCWQLSRFRRR